MDRRSFLGSAAIGAGGLAALASTARAEGEAYASGSDKGKPGEGGAARNSVELPPGAKVAYHNPQDVGAMPDFHYAMDATAPKVTSGGWAKEAKIGRAHV